MLFDIDRKLRQRDASKFHAQLSLALLLMLLVFIVGIDRVENNVACTIMSLSIQYTTLVAVFWMGAEAVLMFKKLIIVFGSITTKFHVITSLICWGMCSNVCIYGRMFMHGSISMYLSPCTCVKLHAWECVIAPQ
ncbi:MAG: hypothetical protein A6F71_09405 [Cycloclasticus sp. symbiont of Poecilosclerida sp. M]|nr:MAG: hypothetical protein A6F71_09405 [Cycloclasticus sp. symbiont of Poecilosclerida sp. M]